MDEKTHARADRKDAQELRRAERDVARGIYLDPEGDQKGDRSDDSELGEL